MSFYVREGTADQAIVASVIEQNEYRLPEQFAPDDIIIDVGAHIGAFSYAALLRGAGAVWAIEADAENCRMAERNLAAAIEAGSTTLLHAAVWRSDSEDEQLYHGGYSSSGGVINTGGGGVIWQREGAPVPAIGLDRIIMAATDGGRRRVRLLKIDCEGAEWPILLTATRLDLVDEIAGEFHEIGGLYDSHTPPFSIAGYERFTIELLQRYLAGQGFHVSGRRHSTADGRPAHMGLFWAITHPQATTQPAPLEAPLAVAADALLPGFRPLTWERPPHPAPQPADPAGRFRPLSLSWRRAE
jgi:FkbM family methyltransferase